MNVVIWITNGLLIVSCGGLAVWLWSAGQVTIGAIALIVALTIRIVNMSGWVIWVVTSIFENIGTVQEGMETISQPHEVVDRPGAAPLVVNHGEIAYEHIRFHYGKEDGGIIDDLSLRIRPGEKVGLVGRSGAGKSTLVNVLLRFYDLEAGRILIDGQDIAGMSARTVCARGSAWLRRTPRCCTARSWTTSSMVDPRPPRPMQSRRPGWHRPTTFIAGLKDAKGREGYEAHVGERGVKLSGGQRQRIAIARVLLKDAPILILDEATSALWIPKSRARSRSNSRTSCRARQ